MANETVKTVEIIGRRSLLLVGFGGMFVFYAMMTISFRYENLSGMNNVSVVATLLVVVFFQVGPGAIPWFITAELFPQSSRAAAVSIAGVANWMSNFVVGLVFPSLQEMLYPYTFLVFMALLAFFFAFTFYLVPETKGKTIEEIARCFRNGNDQRSYNSIEKENNTDEDNE